MKELAKIVFNKEFFNIKDTLECGQIFRFFKCDNGFVVISRDKCAFCYEQDDSSIIECKIEDKEYFYHFFDLDRDYFCICNDALKTGVKILVDAVEKGKGIRILNQDKTETLFSFIVSQNNNIPRIKKIIKTLAISLGEVIDFKGKKYHAFPTIDKLAVMGEKFYKEIGLGYRAEYIRRLAVSMKDGLDIEKFSTLKTSDLKKQLINMYGVGPKVADCVALFGYHRSDSFPVDTWIEKVYREDFNGTLNDRNKISQWFCSQFGENSGYYQQYLFFYKRLIEKSL